MYPQVQSLAIALGLALGACSGNDAGTAQARAAQAPSATSAESTIDGVRHFAIEVLDTGYKPSKFSAKPGESLVLDVTRTTDSACAKQLKIAGGAPVDLPLNQAKAFPVTMPASGELAFTCGMDMMTGVIVPAK